MDIDFNKISNLVADDKNVLIHSCYSERTVRFDMVTRRSKRGYYIEIFNNLWMIIEAL